MTGTVLRYWENLVVGESVALGSTTVSKPMIIAFATAFDPLPFHLDETAAKASLLGGLAASGWQTGALTLRLLADAFLGGIAATGIVAAPSVKWKSPVYAGDTITGVATITELRPVDALGGIAVLQIDMRNQRRKPVLSMTLAQRIERRLQ